MTETSGLPLITISLLIFLFSCHVYQTDGPLVASGYLIVTQQLCVLVFGGA